MRRQEVGLQRDGLAVSIGGRVEPALRLQRQTEIVEQNGMRRPRLDGGFIRGNCNVVLAAAAAEVANSEVRFGLAGSKRDRPEPCVERGIGLRSLKRKPEDGPRFCIGGIALDRSSRVARGFLEAALRETGARNLAERFGTCGAQRSVAVLIALAATAGAGVVAADVAVL